jgi:hypothetical protein
MSAMLHLADALIVTRAAQAWHLTRWHDLQVLA